MSIPRLIARWRADAQRSESCAAWQTMPARPAQFRDIPAGLHPALVSALKNAGISALFSHQEQAWRTVQAGAHLVLATGTASGKTLAYQLPVLDHLLRQPESRALFIYPTKALAQDQQAGLRRLIEALPAQERLPVGVYDGDTPDSQRAGIRAKARLVFSNPDMLHAGILPQHPRWAEFFAGLRYVIVDEIHTYRGVFGSHVANVLRRLRRIAAFYGTRPQFLLTSATIGNPLELAEKLIEAPAALIDEDGSHRGPRHFILYNPPVLDAELGLRRSVLQESVTLTQELLDEQIQTILFGRSRRSVEVMLRYLQQTMTLDEQAKIRGYRSGYLPGERRQVEQALRSGTLQAVVATTALELGIDIGGLGAALMAGYPGTIAGAWQQAGRAGRKDQPALVVMLASANPLDQYLVHHPEYFFERSPEQALVNPDHLLILLDHLGCAAFELPFQPGEGYGRLEAGALQEYLAVLQQGGLVRQSNQRYFWSAAHTPAQAMSLRSASPERIMLHADGKIVGEVDLLSAPWLTHPGAVYLHQAQAYLVEHLDLDNKLANLLPADVDYYTEPHSEINVSLEAVHGSQANPGAQVMHGEITVTSQVVGFRKIQWNTHQTLGTGLLDLPPTNLLTTGYWLVMEAKTVDRLRAEGLWSNDPNNYGPNWDKVRNQVRARDGYRCQVCGTPETERAHHVHHKVPFRKFPSYIEANSLNNLITVCPPCHRRVETAVRIRSGLAGLAFALANLAPLFLMCDPGDLGVHSDPKAALADGEPTVVIYERIPAGIGFSERLFQIHAQLMASALELVSQCACTDGCPSCVGPGGEQGFGGKRETLALLEALNGQPVSRRIAEYSDANSQGLRVDGSA